MAPLDVIIGVEGRDPLVGALREALHEAGRDVLVVPPDQLAGVRVEAGPDAARVNGRLVGLVVLRCPAAGIGAAGFDPTDEPFAAAETRATWLHLMTLASTRTINEPDPVTWFLPSEWPTWRQRLAKAGVPLAPLTIGRSGGEGSQWLTWSGALAQATPPAAAAALSSVAIPAGVQRSLWCVDRVVDGPSTPEAVSAGHVLEWHGIRLAAIDTVDGGVVAATSFPAVPAAVAPAMARALVQEACRDLARR